MPTSAELQLDRLAEEVFELTRLSGSARTSGRRGGGPDLSEYEFVTLDVLTRQDTLTVGELQKHVGVLPAQMSRVIRSLENKPDGPLIACAINARDKRKVDVCLTEAGREAVDGHRTTRLSTIRQMLSCLDASDRAEFIRILRLIRENLAGGGLTNGRRQRG